MSAVENDPGWYQRMADRAARQRPVDQRPIINRDNWPGPAELRGASARDAFLWYVVDAWPKSFGDAEPVEMLFDHDFGYHVLRKGQWELRLINVEEHPDERWPEPEPAPK